ncbi:MAG: TnpV protein [Oscillospiraceae bacterium]|nr:TnpV protein [Oscillospiraceae bacterium]
MENAVEYILDEKTGTYLPKLEMPKEKPLGRYGKLRKKYLMEHHKGVYQSMLMKGKLNEHLTEIESTALRRIEQIVSQMKKELKVTEELKAIDQMKWVGIMNSIRNSAEEIILSELIYS